MSYEFDLETTTRITRDVAEQMIRRIVEDQTGKKVDAIEVRMSRVGKGGSPDSYDTVFDGFVVTFKQERLTTARDPGINKGFVEATYQ